MATFPGTVTSEMATSTYSMADLEIGSPRYDLGRETSSTSTSCASSPIETVPLTPLSDVERRIQNLFVSFDAPFLLQCLPPPVILFYQRSASWVKGPVPPRPYRIKPIFERVQTAPKRLLDLWAPKHHHKIWIVAAFYMLWLLSFIGLLHTSHSPQDMGRYGPPVRLSCTSRLWCEVFSVNTKGSR
jgi:hypothetical protein